MSKQSRTWSLIAAIGIIVLTMACALPGATPQAKEPTATATSDQLTTLPSLAGTATPTAALSVGGGSGGTGSGGGSGGAGSSSGGSSGGLGGNSGGSEGGEPTELADFPGGPYTVKQIETLGGEAISGVVCSVTHPFSVLSVTPHVTFTFLFVPQVASHGNVSYAYSIPSAGESHDAAGTYSLNRVDKDGTLQLSLSVSDHVVFKGFDGNIPNRYKFNLVPTGQASCP